MRKCPAFTVVELLVVVSIVALLIALLLPALAKAKGLANSVTCESNLRQLAYAYTEYTQSSAAQRAGPVFTGGPFFLSLAREFSSNSSLPENNVSFAIPSSELKILICPSAPTASFSPYGGYGTAKSSWILPMSQPKLRSIVSSYGFNGWMYNWEDSPPAPKADIVDGGFGYPQKFWNSSQSTAGAQTPLFSDDIWFTGWVGATNQPPANVEAPWPWTPSDMANLCINRHQGGINVVFVDGHVQHVALGDLWELEWHPDFYPKKVWGGFAPPVDLP